MRTEYTSRDMLQDTLGFAAVDVMSRKLEVLEIALRDGSLAEEQALKAAAPDEWAAWMAIKKRKYKSSEERVDAEFAAIAALMTAAPAEWTAYQKARMAVVEAFNMGAMRDYKAALEAFYEVEAALKEAAPIEFEKFDVANKAINAAELALSAAAQAEWKKYEEANDETREAAQKALKAAAPEQFESYDKARKVCPEIGAALKDAAPEQFKMAMEASEALRAAWDARVEKWVTESKTLIAEGVAKRKAALDEARQVLKMAAPEQFEAHAKAKTALINLLRTTEGSVERILEGDAVEALKNAENALIVKAREEWAAYDAAAEDYSAALREYEQFLMMDRSN